MSRTIGLKIKTAPTIACVSIDDVKAYLHVDSDEEDDNILRWISSAISMVEDSYAHIALNNQTLYYTAVPSANYLRIPRPPLVSITSVKSVKQGTETTISASNYYTDDISSPATVTLKAGYTWGDCDYVKVEYVAGYGTKATDVPAPIRQAIMVAVGAWYYNRESEQKLPVEAQQLIARYAVSNVIFRGE